MPPKRNRGHTLNNEAHELHDGADAGGLEALLQTVYEDLRAARAQLLSEQARNQTLEIEVLELKERINRLQAESVSKEAENSRLLVGVSRMQSQHPSSSPLSGRAPPTDDLNVYVFKLEKAAKSSGGDRFVCESQADFNIYFPQTISRQHAPAPCRFLQLRIERPLEAALASPPPLLQQQSTINVLSVKHERVKQELVSDDDDEPIFLDFKAGSTPRRSFKKSA
jgi:hypothetical protein